MKKLTILLIIILGISLIAYAGATKYTLIEHNNSGAEGTVIVNTNPQKTILEFQVDGLKVGEDVQYWAYYAFSTTEVYELGQLKVNKKGSGHLNAHVPEGISEPFQVGVALTADLDADPIDNDNVVLYVWVP